MTCTEGRQLSRSKGRVFFVFLLCSSFVVVRLLDEKKMVDLLSRAHDLQEQVYAVRWNASIDKPAKKSTVLALKKELMVVEKQIGSVREASVRSFDASLALESLGLGPSDLHESNRVDQADADSGTYVGMNKNIANAPERADDQDLEDIKMMRVASAEVTKEMKPGDKFEYLYGMYSGSKHAGDAKANTMSEEQKVNLRGKIYHLKNSTNLSEADKVLLAELQAQLKAAQ